MSDSYRVASAVSRWPRTNAEVRGNEGGERAAGVLLAGDDAKADSLECGQSAQTALVRAGDIIYTRKRVARRLRVVVGQRLDCGSAGSLYQHAMSAADTAPSGR